MTNRDQKDVVDIFSQFKKTLEAKPSVVEMYEEVRMMKFKIKPLAGDISLLQFDNANLIETLWSLGKLDEMFQKEFKQLAKNEKEVFFRLFDELYLKFQDQLNKVKINPLKKPNFPQFVEMEIFKEIPAKKKAN